jgi:hypothetical protein
MMHQKNTFYFLILIFALLAGTSAWSFYDADKEATPTEKNKQAGVMFGSVGTIIGLASHTQINETKKIFYPDRDIDDLEKRLLQKQGEQDAINKRLAVAEAELRNRKIGKSKQNAVRKIVTLRSERDANEGVVKVLKERLGLQYDDFLRDLRWYRAGRGVGVGLVVIGATATGSAILEEHTDIKISPRSSSSAIDASTAQRAF